MRSGRYESHYFEWWHYGTSRVKIAIPSGRVLEWSDSVGKPQSPIARFGLSFWIEDHTPSISAGGGGFPLSPGAGTQSLQDKGCV